MPRLLRYVLGWLLLVPGFFVFITPVPGGIVMMTAGFLLLYSSSAAFRQIVLSLVSRFPKSKLRLQRYFDFLALVPDNLEGPSISGKTSANRQKEGCVGPDHHRN